METVSISSAQGKLDLNAPLLSIRRHAPFGGDADPVGRTGGGGSSQSVVLGSLRSPGAVPFIWEHSPGHPKAKEITLSVLPAIPAPPGPGRPSAAHTSVNRATDQQKLHYSSYDARHGLVALGDVHSHGFQNNDSPRQAEQQKDKRSDEGVAVKNDLSACSNSVEVEGDAFSDAVDTFDVTEDPSKANTVICSLDCNNHVGLKLGLPHTDPHARDFIMRRFLPAAKAMTVETPAASICYPENRTQKKIQLSPLGQIQRCSIPRPPVTDRLANLTDKKVTEEEEDTEESQLYSKGCGFLPFRLGAAFKHLLPISSPTRLKRKSRLHILQFSRLSEIKNPANLQYKSKSSVVDDVSDSSGTEDEHENGGRERYGSQFNSDRSNFVGNGLMNRIMYSPQKLSNSRGMLRDGIHSNSNVSSSLPDNGKKGFLGLPKEVALALSHKQAYSPGVLETYSSLSPKTQKLLLRGNNANYCNLVAKKNVCFGSPSTGQTQSAQGKKLGKESRIYKAYESDVLKGDESDVSSQSSDIESIYGDGSPRISAETGETSTTDDKIDRSGKHCSNVSLHSEIPSSGVKSLSVAPPQEASWHTESVEQSISSSKFLNDIGTTDSQKLLAHVQIEGDSPLNLHRCFEHSYKNPPLGVLIPPLPKSPSQSWLWRVSPSPTSASLFGQRTPRTAKGEGISSTEGAKWEALVKSGIARPGHLRYSEELSNQNLSVNVHSGPNRTF